MTTSEFRSTRHPGYLRRAARLWPLLASLSLFLILACSVVQPDTVVQENRFPAGESPRLQINSGNGKVTVQGNSGSDSIQITATLRNPDRVEYRAESVDGRVIVTARTRSGFHLFGGSAGADIVVQAPEGVRLDLTTSNGSVSVADVGGPVEAQTSNGKVSLKNVDGDVAARTSNGSVDLENVSGQVTAETSNGSVSLVGTLRSESHNRLRTSNGSVNVTLVDTPGVNLDASTSNGTVKSQLAVASRVSSGQSHLVGTVGQGGPDLEVRTSNGSINIK